MAFYFGLNISRNLTDIADQEEALKNLNLDIKDLNIIKGLTDPGNVSREDFLSLSGLDFDFEAEVASLQSESSTYSVLTSNIYDKKSAINNNLIINGQFAATAIKYNYVDYNESNLSLKIKTADISTSRLSSWSSFDNPITSNSSILYGGEVNVEGPIELSTLTLNKPVDPLRFESEIPTHKIRVTIDGTEVDLYAMKGIPLSFTGFFRNADISANINTVTINGSAIRPSWVIKNTDNNFEYIYENRISNSVSTINFRDTTAKERTISLYYPIDRITRLSLPSINLITLPEVSLSNLTHLYIQGNDIREFPDLSNFNSLQILNISGNNLTRSENTDLNFLNSNIVARLPPTVRELYLGNVFSGTLSADFSGFTNLKVLNLTSGRINRRLSGVAPNVPATIEVYDITYNLFTSLPDNVKNSTTLKSLSISYNNINQNDLTLASQALGTFESIGNSHNLVDVSGIQTLTSYTFRNATINGNNIVTNIFSNCSSLQTISVRETPVVGNLPQFINCNALRSVDFERTSIGGSDENYVIAENTFASCKNTLSFFRLTTPNITPAQQFHPDCLYAMPVLDYILITSSGRGLSGSLPDFNTARNIRYILFYSNRLSGFIPNFDNNVKLFYLHLYYNQFVGPVPNVKTTAFQHLLLAFNQLDSWGELSAVNLRRIHLQYNRIPIIPNLSNLTILDELFFNNQSLSGASMSYTAGSFVGMRIIRSINGSNNNITEGDINQMLLDLSENYDNNPRRGVVVNLRGNAAPSQTEEIQTIITKLQVGGWIIQTN